MDEPMSEEKAPTFDDPKVKEHPKCFKCERYVKCAVRTDSAEDYWEFPWGLSFRGGGNFGSARYDSLMDGIGVDIIICDDCLEKYKHLLREVFRGEPCDGRFAALQFPSEKTLQDKSGQDTDKKET